MVDATKPDVTGRFLDFISVWYNSKSVKTRFAIKGVTLAIAVGLVYFGKIDLAEVTAIIDRIFG